MQDPVAGIVLAGGKSRRMGRDKARLVLPDGRPLILSILELLKDVCDEVVVVTDAPGRYADLALPAREVTDIVPGQGPLGGLQAGLRAIQAPFALTVACDMPFLNPSLLRYMVGLPRDYEALVPIVEGRWQPLHSIYAKDCLATVEDLLDRGLLALTDLLSRVRLRALPLATVQRFDPQGLSFLNLNEPGDLLALPDPAGKCTTGPRPGSRR